MVEHPTRFHYIVVFGAAVRADGSPSGTLRRRVEAAFRHGRSLPHVRFLVTGGLCRHPPEEAEVMRRLLLSMGALEEQVVVENTARNTRESAIRCAGILRDRGDAASVVLCSSQYHVRRCGMLLRLNGIRPNGVVASADASRVGPRRYAYATVRDWCAYPWDAALMCGAQLRRALSAGTGERRRATGD